MVSKYEEMQISIYLYKKPYSLNSNNFIYHKETEYSFSKQTYLFIFKERVRKEKERERNINVWLPFMRP